MQMTRQSDLTPAPAKAGESIKPGVQTPGHEPL
jgi:hypothetical protein